MANLSGKDYLTIQDAAAYCGVSESQFRAKCPLQAGTLWGKKLYRRTDLQAMIEREAWQQFNGASTVERTARSQKQRRSTGQREASNAA